MVFDEPTGNRDIANEHLIIEEAKKLARENFSNLAPSKALVVLEYSHPPLSERIAAVEKTIRS